MAVSLTVASPEVLTHWFSGCLKAALAASTEDTPGPAAFHAVVVGLGPGLALLAFIFGGALLVTLAVAQLVSGGLALSWEALIPRFERINPAMGMMRLSGSGAWGSAGLGLLKLLLGMAVVIGAASGLVAGVLAAASASQVNVLALASSRFLSVGFGLGSSLLGAALLQGMWAKKRWMDELKMSHQEAIEDAKESEGDPRTRRRFRQMHRKLARQRTMQAVAASDVVLANPTHFAVALRYKRGRMRAPRVMAKGADLMAQRIKEAARKSGIPVIEQPALARDLYASVAVGKEIPARLYRAVARVIHQIQGLTARRPRLAPAA
jgi:flagellar biosynthetic protein FlhB